MSYIIAYDLGTTGVKTCLFRVFRNEKHDLSCDENQKTNSDQVDNSMELALIDSEFEGYGITLLENGGAEQEPEDWWQAIVKTTQVLNRAHRDEMSTVKGISFCSQMQGLSLVDKDYEPLRPSMSYMDQRAGAVRQAHIGRGPKIADTGIKLLLKSLYYTGAVAASDKDPVWKYLWVKENEPDVFSRVDKWLDVKETVIARMTGKAVMSADTAFATLLCDQHANIPTFSRAMLRQLGVNPKHLPIIVGSTECVGVIKPECARELGLPVDVKVFAGGGDASLIGLGAGCVKPGDAHIYMGTSGWFSVITDRRLVDTSARIASVVGVQAGLYNYFAELETAGKCLEWVRDHLALDEINVYLEKRPVTEDEETTYASMYDYLSEVMERAVAGSGGVIFTPWLHGNRCPFEDPNVRGTFFNFGLETGKTELVRSVIEGVCYHMRWFYDLINKRLPVGDRVRFVGGGALSKVTAQILSDVLQKQIETVRYPQNVGAVGAAILAAKGLGYISDLSLAASILPVEHVYTPNSANADVYSRQYEVFKSFYKKNQSLYRRLNTW